MFNISGFAPQVSTGTPAPQEAKVAPQAAPEAPEPQDAFLPSENLKDGGDNMAVGDRGALVREDLKDRSFLVKETEHLILYYLAGTEAEKDIDDIAQKREQALEIICSFLNIEVSGRISIYIFPTDKDSYCPTWKKTFAGRAIPEARMIGIAYTADEEAYEKVNIGHELTHVLEYELLPPHKRVPPFMREGLADFLSLSNEDMNVRLLRFLNAGLVQSPFILTDVKLNAPEYMESASLVQFIIGKFGLEAFVSFYRGLACLDKGEKLSLEDFTALWEMELCVPLAACSAMWEESVRTTPPPLAAVTHEERGELEEFLSRLEKAREGGQKEELLALTGRDFYYFSPQKEKELAALHLSIPPASSIALLGTVALGTWGYGKTMALRVLRRAADAPGAPEEERLFLVERLLGRWSMSPKYPAGWA
jgi:hypothetical protein